VRFLILFLTRRCNARCRSCFYAGHLNDGSEEMTLEQYERLADSAGSFSNLLFSGGEPSLRQDAPRIASAFYRRCSIRHLGFPTNGLLPGRALESVERILAECPDLKVDLNVSLDGLGEAHDRIRGVPGNFVRAEETLRRAAELRRCCPRFRVNVETVIANANAREIPRLLDYVWTHHEVDGHYAEVIRGNPPDAALRPPGRWRLWLAHRAVLRNHRRYRARSARGPSGFELAAIGRMYRLQRQFLRRGSWPFPCVAGRTIAAIEPTGEARLCELKGVVGRLEDFDWDLRRLLDSEAAQAARQEIADSHCACTHCVFAFESLLDDPRRAAPLFARGDRLDRRRAKPR